MKEEWVVLHLTDLHISDPASANEHLRLNYFREYIDELAGVVKKINIGKVDAIVITGDFIDYGNRDGKAKAKFAHAKNVVDYLSSKFEVQKKAVFACNGNHDVDRTLDESGKYCDARKDFAAFASEYGNAGEPDNFCQVNLVKTEFSAHVLLLDSTKNPSVNNRPGTITDAEIDDVMERIRQADIKHGELLIVAAHYPTCPYIAAYAPFDDDNSEWSAEHMWSSAQPIYARLLKCSKAPVLWLSGDIHREDYVIEKPIHSFVTGRLGTASGGANSSQVRRQARVISIPTDGESRSWLCEYVPEGHRDQAQIGKWQIKEQEPVVVGRRSGAQSSSANIVQQAAGTTPLQDENCESSDVLLAKCTTVELLSGELQAEIVSTIAHKELYSMGRFATSKTESTLAWIPMGALLDQGELLMLLVTQMAREVKRELAEVQPRRPIIVGVDSWGSILASQVSVMTGVKNFCVAGRAKGLTHSASERISETVRNGVLECDLVVLISDVIGTGMALKGVYDDLSEKMTSEQKAKVKWALLSVICDDSYNREANLHFAHINKTACKDLRMPILKNDELPSEAVLPANISFVRH